MTMSENIYQQLGRLIETMPDLNTCDVMSTEVNLWLERAYTLVNEVGDVVATFKFKTNVDNLHSAERSSAVPSIHSIIYRALATAELAAPAGTSGAFIPAVNSFDAFTTISKIFATAIKDVLIIDPYRDAVALTGFGIAVPEKISLRLMTA